MKAKYCPAVSLLFRLMIPAQTITAMGGVHQTCAVDACVIDEQHKVVSTPAYMLAHSIKEAASGIKKLVTAVLNLT